MLYVCVYVAQPHDAESGEHANLSAAPFVLRSTALADPLCTDVVNLIFSGRDWLIVARQLGD